MLASAGEAKRFGDKAVWISGIGNSTDAYWTDRDLSQSEALQDAASRALRASEMGDFSGVDVAEISARYAYEEPLYATALGFCEGKDVRKWINDPANSPSVNPSGGAIAGNPATVIGLTRAVEIYLQLTGQAGERQVEGAKVGLAHGRDGICGQNHSVVILRSHAAVQ